MTCNVCNMNLEYCERLSYEDPNKNYDPYDKFAVNYDDEYERFNLDVQYDAGYATTCIYDIKFCPMCGRKLQ